jgi:hypothetical protein
MHLKQMSQATVSRISSDDRFSVAEETPRAGMLSHKEPHVPDPLDVHILQIEYRIVTECRLNEGWWHRT